MSRRPSAREEQLEREVAMLRADLARIRQDPGDMPVAGCGDSACLIATPVGMHTNGGCRCDERRLARALMWWRRRSQFLVETVRDLRGQVADLGARAIEIEAAVSIARAASTEDAFDRAHVAMRRAFPCLAASYPCECAACRKAQPTGGDS